MLLSIAFVFSSVVSLLASLAARFSMAATFILFVLAVVGVTEWGIIPPFLIASVIALIVFVIFYFIALVLKDEV